MSQRSIRFPDELEAAYEAKAAQDDRSFSYVVLRTLEKALSDTAQESPASGAPPARVAAAPSPTSRADAFRSAAHKRY